MDGDPSNKFFKDFSCTHAQGDPIPWWTVDLQGEYLVTDVVITNRGDCCGNTLKIFHLDPAFRFAKVKVEVDMKRFHLLHFCHKNKMGRFNTAFIGDFVRFIVGGTSLISNLQNLSLSPKGDF